MSIIFYRRPDYVAKLPGPMSVAQCQVYVDRTQKHRRSIPPELSFEKIIENKALPPCTLQDFMEYLVYVSHDAENLQFWLWIQDYTERFSTSPKSDQVLSQPWSEIESTQPNGTAFERRPQTADKHKNSTAEYNVNFENNAGHHVFPIISPQFDKQSFMSSTANSSRTVPDFRDVVNAQMGLKWQPFTIQPFRSEIDFVISQYLTPDSPRELNLSHRTRTAVLHALQHTTHPSAFSIVKGMVETTLRSQSHPNFVRWSICNGNKPRILFVRNCGIAHALGGFILGVLLVLSNKSRWWRLLVAPLFLVGFCIGVAAYKGLCVIIHATHSRALRPWEQSDDSATADEVVFSTNEINSVSGRSKKGISLDTIGTSNRYGHEPWVKKYEKRSLFRKIFSRQIWIQNETIRVLQDRIVIQSHIWSILMTIPLTALFVALPAFGLI